MAEESGKLDDWGDVAYYGFPAYYLTKHFQHYYSEAEEESLSQLELPGYDYFARSENQQEGSLEGSSGRPAKFESCLDSQSYYL